LPVVLYGGEIWSFGLKANHRMRVCDGRIRASNMGLEKNCVRSGSMTCASLHIFFDLGGLGGKFDMYGREVGTENLKERANFEDLGVDGRIIFNWILNK